MNLVNIDFNLLKMLDALITERNVTRAGERLGRTQPAMSNALQRLRQLLRDQLLVREPGGFALTPRAESIQQPLREAIALFESCLDEKNAFDPARASGVFRLSVPDRLSLVVVPPLLERLQKQAPNMELQVLTADRKPALELLKQDSTDLALGWLDQKPDYLSAEFMLSENLFCVFRPGHPILKRGTKYNIATVLSFPHVIVSATGERTAIFDDLLLLHSLRRHALVSVTNFTSVPYLLTHSNMIGVFTKLASDVFENTFRLKKRPVPINVGKISTQMVWHSRHDRDQKHVWLRSQIKAIYQRFRLSRRQSAKK